MNDAEFQMCLNNEENQVEGSDMHHVVVMVAKDDDYNKVYQGLVYTFGEDKVEFGGEPKFFPGMCRIVIYK